MSETVCWLMPHGAGPRPATVTALESNGITRGRIPRALRERELEYGPLGLHTKSFYLFVLWCAHETSLCCRGTSQPSSALGPLTMCGGAPLRAEAIQGLPALAQYDLWHSVVIGGIPNVSALPLSTRDVPLRCPQRKAENVGGLSKRENGQRNYAPSLPDLYQSLNSSRYRMPSGSDALVSINNAPLLFLRVLAVEALASPGRKASMMTF